MLLASWAVVYVNDGQNGGLGVQGLASLPVVYKETGQGTAGEKLGHAIVNALVIVGIVIGMTTLLVTLYYFKCMKIIVGWLLLSTGVLLGLSSQYMVQIAISVYQITTDYPTYVFFFGTTPSGTWAIFTKESSTLAPRLVRDADLLVFVTLQWRGFSFAFFPSGRRGRCSFSLRSTICALSSRRAGRLNFSWRWRKTETIRSPDFCSKLRSSAMRTKKLQKGRDANHRPRLRPSLLI